jgi:hypothetical protein
MEIISILILINKSVGCPTSSSVHHYHIVDSEHSTVIPNFIVMYRVFMISCSIIAFYWLLEYIVSLGMNTVAFRLDPSPVCEVHTYLDRENFRLHHLPYSDASPGPDFLSSDGSKFIAQAPSQQDPISIHFIHSAYIGRTRLNSEECTRNTTYGFINECETMTPLDADTSIKKPGRSTDFVASQ